MTNKYFNYTLRVSKAANGAFVGAARSDVDGRVLFTDPRETEARALFAAKLAADNDMMDAAEAVSHGERF